MKLTAPDYPRSFLFKCLNSNYEPVAIWGAVELIRQREKPNVEELSRFLNSPFSVIQEAGLVQLAEQGPGQLISGLIRLFREAEGQLKYQAAYCLAMVPNDFSKNLLAKWFDQVLTSSGSTRIELEAAAISYLEVSPQHLDLLLAKLGEMGADLIRGSVLFGQALPYCQKPEQFGLLMDFYFRLRDHFADLETIDRLVKVLGQRELKDWLVGSLSLGYDVKSVYRQCCKLLGWDPGIQEEALWTKLEQAGIRFDAIHPIAPSRPDLMLSGLKSWLVLLLEGSEDQRALWLVEAFERNLGHMSATIPKILEIELELLLSLPLIALSDRSINRWLQRPGEHLSEIAAYYHSALLTEEHQAAILALFFPQAPDWKPESMWITQAQSPVGIESPKGEVLWSFFKGELLGYPVPWPSLFPNPGYRKYLAEGLTQIYLANLDRFIEADDHLSIDYALQLFQFRPSLEALAKLVEHFNYLQQYHADLLYQTLELMPQKAMINRLADLYQPGEYDLARLIAFLAHAFEEPVPAGVEVDLIHPNQRPGLKKPVRLTCPECRHSYQYFADVIYVDEGTLQRSGRLGPNSVWSPRTFTCKKCGHPLPLILDEGQLEELTLQSKVDRLLRLNSALPGLGQRIVLVDFPRHHGKAYNPDQFAELIESLTFNQATDPDELRQLWIKEARMLKSLSRYHEALMCLSKLDPPEPKEELEWHFLQGLCYYKLGQYPASRPHLDQVLGWYSPGQTDQPFLEEARSFLKSMSENKNRFVVIEGKK